MLYGRLCYRISAPFYLITVISLKGVKLIDEEFLKLQNCMVGNPRYCHRVIFA